MKITLTAGAVLATVGLALAARPFGPQEVAEVGQTVDHKFSSPPTNSFGLKSLSELRGKPVLVEFWGTK